MKKIIYLFLFIILVIFIFWYFYQNSERQVVDDVENGGEIILKEDVSREEDLSFLVGTWQSTDDELSVKVFSKDGLLDDIYDGVVMSSGTWAFNSHNGVASLHIHIDGEDYEYILLTMSKHELSLSYLPRGNTLNFKRIND